MTKNKMVKFEETIKNRIYTIRGFQVMLDRDLAELYGVETRVLNQAVKRNIERFPDEFCFLMTNMEFTEWRSQTVMSNNLKVGLRWKPYVFTELGVAMLAGVLKSEIAVKISIRIIRAFVEMRKLILTNSQVFQRLSLIETKQSETILKLIETDKRVDKIFSLMESGENLPKQGIFFDGQIFDAYRFVSDLFRSAKSSIVVLDNYIDDTVLTHLKKVKPGIKVTLLTKSVSGQLRLDAEKFGNQYFPIEIKEFKRSHDRFMIIDGTEVYHFGASLKDLGKKWFAFSKIEKESFKLISELEMLL
ncbi:MAG: ORF6N domain-containing protein [Candidatus Delongbacteria bacterium]|nr:ORF6N domain-containing protein [Candidatus Delongbacteria bacterium]